MTEAEKALKAMRVRDNVFALRDIDKSEYGAERYAALCLDAVKAHGIALQFISKESRTPEVCLEAVKQNSSALYFLLPHDKREQMVNDTRHLDVNSRMLAEENNFTSTDAFNILQASMGTDGYGAAGLAESLPVEETYAEAYPELEIFSQTAGNTGEYPNDLTFFQDYVRSEGALQDISPADFSHADYAAICRVAVVEHGAALRFVKNGESRTPDVLAAAVMQQGDALRHFSDAGRPLPCRGQEQPAGAPAHQA
jgi:hypothetical protein